MSKKETLMVHIKWFYRTYEVPEQVYHLLIQDRQTEHKHLNSELQKKISAAEKSGESVEGLEKPRKLDVMMLRMRELFTSDATDVHPVSVLRGKCDVHHCQDTRAIRDFVPQENTFFFTLSYNPETRRLASTQGEIRVGASHQANLPELRPPLEPPSNNHNNNDDEDESDEEGRDLEDLTWSPGRIHDHDLLMYLRAGRSMAAFASMCDGSNADELFQCASRDSITANALQVLHDSDYEAGKAVQSLLKTPFPTASMGDIQRRWPEEDVKQFIKGLRTYGKDFFKIRVDYLPDKDTSELVEFYYLWKKTPGANNHRPRGRRPAVRPAVLRRVKGGPGVKGYKSARNEGDPTDVSSASDGEEIEMDFERGKQQRLNKENNENGDKNAVNGAATEENGLDDAADNGEENGEYSNPYYCRHCFASSSKDWHHSGKEKLLLCRECRVYFKKYGELPILEPLKREPTPSDFADDESDAEDVEPVQIKNEAKEELKDVKDEPKPLIKVPEDEALNLNAIEQDSKLFEKSKAQQPSPLLTRASPSSMKPPSLMDLRQPPQAHSSSTFGLGAPGNLPPPPLAPPHHKAFGSIPPHHLGLGLPPLPHPSYIPPGPGLAPPPLLPSSRSNQPPFSSPNRPPDRPRSVDVQVISERYNSSPQQQQPPVPRPASPPPKVDGSECHRSQSAIFTRHWNRGENNSCARTDLHFKPVPDSTLARKRDDRLRKAQIEREETNFRMAHAQAQQEAMAKLNAARMDPHNPFADPFAAAAAAAHHLRGQLPPPPSSNPQRPVSRGGPTPPRFPPGHPLGPTSMEQHMKQIEQLERERMDRERREQDALRLSIGGLPTSRSPFGPPGNPFPTPTTSAHQPPPPSHSQPSGTGAPLLFGDGRRLEEMARAASAERQYAERMNALATDPLVRLQMAGVNPEIPGASHSQMMAAAAAAGLPGLHPAYASLLGAGHLGAHGAPRPPAPGLDPRFRPPGGSANDLAAALRAVHPGGIPGLPPVSNAASMEMLQRQYAHELDLLRLHQQQNSRP